MRNSDCKKSLALLAQRPRTYAWADMLDAGTPCIGRNDVLAGEALEAYADQVAQILKSMPKYSALHLALGEAIAEDMGNAWITFDVLVKVLARALVGVDTYEDLEALSEFAYKVQGRMAEKGIARMENLDDLL